MQKAAEELKKQQQKEAEEKKKAVESRVPKLQIDGLDKCELSITLLLRNTCVSFCCNFSMHWDYNKSMRRTCLQYTSCVLLQRGSRRKYVNCMTLYVV